MKFNHVTSNCTRSDSQLFCEDSNCRSHHAVTLLVAKTEEEADKVLYCLIARYPSTKNDVFKAYWKHFDVAYWSVKMDRPVDNALFGIFHEYCEGVRDAISIKW